MSAATIYTGETRKITIRVVYEISREPLPLTGYTTILVKFKKSNRNTLTKSTSSGGVTVIDERLSKIRVDLTASDTKSLKVGKRQEFEVEIQTGNHVRIARFPRQLNVIHKY